MATGTLYSAKIVGAELPKEAKPLLITHYTVVGRTPQDYKIDLVGKEKPFITTNLEDWLGEGDYITQNLAGLLGAEAKTLVAINPPPNYGEKGLRALFWSFTPRLDWPALFANLPTDYWDNMSGSIVGSPKELPDIVGSSWNIRIFKDEPWIRIDGIGYYIYPLVALRSKVVEEVKYDFLQTQLYVQDNNLIVPSSIELNKIARFLQPEIPDEKWVRSEVERFERNGKNIKETEILFAYKALRDEIPAHLIRPKEILALPLI